MGAPDRHLCRQPPAYEVADERHLVQTQLLQEPQGEVGEVGEGLQPGRSLGAAETREGGSINGEVLGKTAVISEPPQIAFDTVEHHQWPALASSQQMDLRSSYFNKLFVRFRSRHIYVLRVTIRPKFLPNSQVYKSPLPRSGRRRKKRF